MTTAFYHVGGHNHWREIVAEQLRCLGNAQFPHLIYVHYGGPIDEQWFIQRVVDVHNLKISFLPNQPGREECPVLEAAQQHALTAPPDERILYFHTKGITHLNDWAVVQWRWMMNAYMLTFWESAIAELINGKWDFVAPQVFGGHIPHSSGNFWWTTAKYLSRLKDFRQYYDTFLEAYGRKVPSFWSRRHAAEAWIGSGEPLRCHQLIEFPVTMWDHSSWVRNVAAQTFATKHGS